MSTGIRSAFYLCTSTLLMYWESLATYTLLLVRTKLIDRDFFIKVTKSTKRRYLIFICSRLQLQLYCFMILKLYLLALTLLVAGAKSIKGHRGALLLAWPGYECQKLKQSKIVVERCDPHKLELWDYQSFIIRGFRFDKGQSRTVSELDFNSILSDQYLQERMMKYCPTFFPTAESRLKLWSAIWKNSNYPLNKQTAQSATKAVGNEASYDIEQSLFFHQMVYLYQSFNPKKMADRQYTTDRLAKELGVNSDQLFLRCDTLGFLSEVGICFAEKNGKYKASRCAKELGQCLKKRVFLKNWRVHQRDIDVFDWREVEQLDLRQFGDLDSFLLMGLGLAVLMTISRMISCLQETQIQDVKPKPKQAAKHRWNSLKL